jgi:hypothetical protein
VGRNSIAIVLLFIVGVVGCDRVPGDPLDERTDLSALLADGRTAAPGLSLPGLVYSAVHRVYAEQGASAARALVAELRRLEQADRSAANGAGRGETASHRDALHAEEVRIVLRVYGAAIVPRVVEAVRQDALGWTQRVAAEERAGRDMSGARELLARIETQLGVAVMAQERGDAAGALDAATRAAAVGEALATALEDARRIVDLDGLFAMAAQRLGIAQGVGAASGALARNEELSRAADAAVRAGGDAERVHAALKAVRDERIRLVLDVLGQSSLDRLLTDSREGLIELESVLQRARTAGRDVTRLQRMAATSRDLLHRATLARQAGDADVALDLASHAAGLINAARAGLRF